MLAYPFGLPGQSAELRGREAIRDYFKDLSGARDLLVMDGVEAVVRETDDPGLSHQHRGSQPGRPAHHRGPLPTESGG